MRISNCIGFAYHELGIIAEEMVCDCPTVFELLEKFDAVNKKGPADAVAVVAPFNGEIVAVHVAVLIGEDDFIRHRRGGREPETDSLEKGLANYLQNYEGSRLVFLKLKQK